MIPFEVRLFLEFDVWLKFIWKITLRCTRNVLKKIESKKPLKLAGNIPHQFYIWMYLSFVFVLKKIQVVIHHRHGCRTHWKRRDQTTLYPGKCHSSGLDSNTLSMFSFAIENPFSIQCSYQSVPLVVYYLIFEINSRTSQVNPWTSSSSRLGPISKNCLCRTYCLTIVVGFFPPKKNKFLVLFCPTPFFYFFYFTFTT